MKKLLPFLAIFFLLVSCGDDDDASNNDLTELIVGVYIINGNPSDGSIVVDKIGDNNVSISFIGASYNLPTFTDVVLNSETSFTVNELKVESTGVLPTNPDCEYYLVYNGNGNITTNSISISLIRTFEPRGTNPCTSNDVSINFPQNISYEGVKQ